VRVPLRAHTCHAEHWSRCAGRDAAFGRQPPLFSLAYVCGKLAVLHSTLMARVHLLESWFPASTNRAVLDGYLRMAYAGNRDDFSIPLPEIDLFDLAPDAFT
jgi:hypothetical protein